MPRYAGFLRAINVGGRRVTNEQLRSCLERAGFERVATFRASGNVILDTGEALSDEEVAARVESVLAEDLSFEVPVFLREASELRRIAAHEPFDPAELERSAGKLQVMFLAAAPKKSVAAEVLDLASDEDRLALRGRELYWLPSGGISDSALDLKLIAAALGPSTTRTKGTVEQIAAKYL